MSQDRRYFGETHKRDSTLSSKAETAPGRPTIVETDDATCLSFQVPEYDAQEILDILGEEYGVSSEEPNPSEMLVYTHFDGLTVRFSELSGRDDQVRVNEEKDSIEHCLNIYGLFHEVEEDLAGEAESIHKKADLN